MIQFQKTNLCKNCLNVTSNIACRHYNDIINLKPILLKTIGEHQLTRQVWCSHDLSDSEVRLGRDILPPPCRLRYLRWSNSPRKIELNPKILNEQQAFQIKVKVRDKAVSSEI